MKLDARDDSGLTADQQILLAGFGNTIIHDCAVIIVESMVYGASLFPRFRPRRSLLTMQFNLIQRCTLSPSFPYYAY